MAETEEAKVPNPKRSAAMKRSWKQRRAKKKSAKKSLREQYRLDARPRTAKKAKRAPRSGADTPSELTAAMGMAEALLGLLAPFARKTQIAILDFIYEKT